MMDVRLLPSRLRPGIGQMPARENRRAWLPQQTRFCPVVEDVNKLGLLVYPPLKANEALRARHTDHGALVLTLFVTRGDGETVPAVEATFAPGEQGGIESAEITCSRRGGFSKARARDALAALVADVNSPTGSFGLRGAYRFLTPPGVDTVFTAVFNELPRPIVPALTTRVSTDLAVEDTVFWFALRPGAVLSAVDGGPIGQVFFVPREEVWLVDASPAEEQRFAEVQREYWAERATKEKTTNYGATFTYHYRDHQRARRDGAGHALGPLGDAD